MRTHFVWWSVASPSSQQPPSVDEKFFPCPSAALFSVFLVCYLVSLALDASAHLVLFNRHVETCREWWKTASIADYSVYPFVQQIAKDPVEVAFGSGSYLISSNCVYKVCGSRRMYRSFIAFYQRSLLPDWMDLRVQSTSKLNLYYGPGTPFRVGNRPA
jgi:hypothetical protein